MALLALRPVITPLTRAFNLDWWSIRDGLGKSKISDDGATKSATKRRLVSFNLAFRTSVEGYLGILFARFFGVVEGLE